MEKKKYRVRKKNTNKSDVQKFTTDSFVKGRVDGAKNLIGSNLMSFNQEEERKRKEEELRMLVEQVPQIMKRGGQPLFQYQKDGPPFDDGDTSKTGEVEGFTTEGVYDIIEGDTPMFNAEMFQGKTPQQISDLRSSLSYQYQQNPGTLDQTATSKNQIVDSKFTNQGYYDAVNKYTGSNYAKTDDGVWSNIQKPKETVSRPNPNPFVPGFKFEDGKLYQRRVGKVTGKEHWQRSNHTMAKKYTQNNSDYLKDGEDINPNLEDFANSFNSRNMTAVDTGRLNIHQTGGQPYPQKFEYPEDTSYSYSDNTVNNINQFSQGIEDTEQGMGEAFGDVRNTIVDYFGNRNTEDGDSVEHENLESPEYEAKEDDLHQAKYGDNIYDKIRLADLARSKMIPQELPLGNSNGIIDEEELKSYILNTKGPEFYEKWNKDRLEKINYHVPNSVPPFLNSGTPFLNKNRPYDPYNLLNFRPKTAAYLDITYEPLTGDDKKTGPPTTEIIKETEENQAAVDDALNGTEKKSEKEEKKSRGNTDEYTESESNDKKKTPNVKHLDDVRPRYGTPMGKFKIRGTYSDQFGNKRRFRQKYKTMERPTDMYGNVQGRVDGYYGDASDKFRKRKGQSERRGENREEKEVVKRPNEKVFNWRGKLKDEYYETVEDKFNQKEIDKAFANKKTGKRYSGPIDPNEKYQVGGQNGYSFGNNTNSFGNTTDNFMGSPFQPASFEDVGQYEQNQNPIQTPNQQGFGGGNGNTFGKGKGPMGNATSGADLSMGETFNPMNFQEKQDLMNGDGNNNDFSARSKWKRTGMQADQIADLSLNGLKGINQFLENRRFNKDKENQYTGADAFASIGNASNMNQGRFDSGNMSGGAFSDRTPIQFAQHGIEYEDGGEYELSEEEIQEIINNGGSVEYL